MHKPVDLSQTPRQFKMMLSLTYFNLKFSMFPTK